MNKSQYQIARNHFSSTLLCEEPIAFFTNQIYQKSGRTSKEKKIIFVLHCKNTGICKRKFHENEMNLLAILTVTPTDPSLNSLSTKTIIICETM